MEKCGHTWQELNHTYTCTREPDHPGLHAEQQGMWESRAVKSPTTYVIQDYQEDLS